MSEENEKEEKHKESSNITISVTSGSFPLQIFKKWDKDCVENFGNCRWMKMWHDHLSSQRFDIFAFLIDEVQELNKKISKLEGKPEKKERKVVRTLGAEIEEDE